MGGISLPKERISTRIGSGLRFPNPIGYINNKGGQGIMNTQNAMISSPKIQKIIIKAQNGSRIPYDKTLAISPTQCGSNNFAIVAIFDTNNKAHPKDVLFRGTKEECNKWLDWFDNQLILAQQLSFAILDYPNDVTDIFQKASAIYRNDSERRNK